MQNKTFALHVWHAACAMSASQQHPNHTTWVASTDCQETIPEKGRFNLHWHPAQATNVAHSKQPQATALHVSFSRCLTKLLLVRTLQGPVASRSLRCPKQTYKSVAG